MLIHQVTEQMHSDDMTDMTVNCSSISSVYDRSNTQWWRTFRQSNSNSSNTIYGWLCVRLHGTVVMLVMLLWCDNLQKFPCSKVINIGRVYGNVVKQPRKKQLLVLLFFIFNFVSSVTCFCIKLYSIFHEKYVTSRSMTVSLTYILFKPLSSWMNFMQPCEMVHISVIAHTLCHCWLLLWTQIYLWILSFYVVVTLDIATSVLSNILYKLTVCCFKLYQVEQVCFYNDIT